MRGRLAAVALGAGLAFALLAPVAAGWGDPTAELVAGGSPGPKFDKTAKRTGGGATVALAGPLACTETEIAEGLQVTIRITLAQRGARAAGEALWRGTCAKGRWKVSVRSTETFQAGNANACALGIQKRDGAVHDVLLWCQRIKLVA
jgi:hypothetical protein